MKTFIQPGKTLTFAAPYNVLSGVGFKVGAFFAVAAFDALSGAPVEGQLEGVFSLVKTTSQTWAVGDKIYWDNSAKACTNVAAGNMLIGVATAAAGGSATTGELRLVPMVDRILYASASLDFASIATTATGDLTISVPGAEVGDCVALALPASPAAGLVFFAFVSAADTVKVRAMNITGSGVDAASGTYGVTVFKH